MANIGEKSAIFAGGHFEITLVVLRLGKLLNTGLTLLIASFVVGMADVMPIIKTIIAKMVIRAI